MARIAVSGVSDFDPVPFAVFDYERVAFFQIGEIPTAELLVAFLVRRALD